MRIDIDPHWRVRAVGTVNLPMSATAVWGQMRDFQSFMKADPLHASVSVLSTGDTDLRWPPHRARLVIRHRFLGFGPDRIGRIVRWREGRGFAFSDLSRRGFRKGFPHVCAYELESMGSNACRLHISAIGRWTARWMPRWLIRLWLWWVIARTEQCIIRQFRAIRNWRDRNSRAKRTRANDG